ncbi:membrane hypothetical protein [Desulfosarcina cetonica]|uniref:hypothetical protein n=1 Tax=Desulfosarcina cetonica TaxID=90730 RepID=UPI0012EE85F4|nr:hypothetical protein [Desulfosarcina cetonica]VTR71129.1 membrane hypothetical protein [Desulfosarcina cetonica]
MNKTTGILLTILFLFASFWIGEAGKGIFHLTPYMIGLIGMVLIPFQVPKKWKYKTLLSVAFILLYAVSFYIGNLSFYRAYNACIEEAEQVRVELSSYKTKHGNYPVALNDLNIPLPCSRCLRGTILEYESTDTDYKIRFSDWLVEHVATETQPFIAHK